MNELICRLSVQPGLTILLSAFFGLVIFIMNRYLLSALLKMHRSKTAVKKIEKQYSFAPKFLLYHVRDHCKHAPKFTKRMIWTHHFNLFVTVFVCLIAIISFFVPEQGIVSAWALIAQVVLVFLPVSIMELLFDKHPFRKNKHAYRFTDHHNSDDHESLF